MVLAPEPPVGLLCQRMAQVGQSVISTSKPQAFADEQLIGRTYMFFRENFLLWDQVIEYA